MSPDKNLKPCVGIPYRTRKEELSGERGKYCKYIEAVQKAGGEPVEISLSLSPVALRTLAESLDSVVLTGSPADVEPSLYQAPRNPKSAEADADRERTDFALLEHAFAEHKPVLAICYGNQSLNVFLGGSLVQDISSELHSNIQHAWIGRDRGVPEPSHPAHIESGSRLSRLAGSSDVQVNSSHHQAILKPGRNLNVVGRAADGVIEAVEWTGDTNWVIGVQWHPERMAGSDPLAQALFLDLLAAARKAPVQS